MIIITCGQCCWHPLSSTGILVQRIINFVGGTLLFVYSSRPSSTYNYSAVKLLLTLLSLPNLSAFQWTQPSTEGFSLPHSSSPSNTSRLLPSLITQEIVWVTLWNLIIVWLNTLLNIALTYSQFSFWKYNLNWAVSIKRARTIFINARLIKVY